MGTVWTPVQRIRSKVIQASAAVAHQMMTLMATVLQTVSTRARSTETSSGRACVAAMVVMLIRTATVCLTALTHVLMIQKRRRLESAGAVCQIVMQTATESLIAS